MTYVSDDSSKLPTLLQHLSLPYNPPLLVFVSTQPRASSLAEELVLSGIPNVDCLHAGMTKKEREDAISRMTFAMLDHEKISEIDASEEAINTYVFKNGASSSVKYVTALPSLPARPVRPVYGRVGPSGCKHLHHQIEAVPIRCT